jgi:hypothetical protein
MANEKLLASQYRHNILKLIGMIQFWENKLEGERTRSITPDHLMSSTEEDLQAHLSAVMESALEIYGHVDWETGYLMPDGEGPQAPTRKRPVSWTTPECPMDCPHDHEDIIMSGEHREVSPTHRQTGLCSIFCTHPSHQDTPDTKSP